MLVERINLQKKLEVLREVEVQKAFFLQQARNALISNKNYSEPAEEIENISSNRAGNLDFDLLETERIFHLSQIKKICVTYRLRFLSAEYYKGAFPPYAVSEIQLIEKDHHCSLTSFSIVAPAEFFRLENADDPLLFTPMGNDYFYLVYKWGTDIHPLRKVFKWPLKNFENLLLFSAFLSLVLSFGIRTIFFSSNMASSEFIIIWMYTFKSLIALMVFYGICLGKNFSSGNWNSKFYNN